MHGGDHLLGVLELGRGDLLGGVALLGQLLAVLLQGGEVLGGELGVELLCRSLDVGLLLCGCLLLSLWLGRLLLSLWLGRRLRLR